MQYIAYLTHNPQDFFNGYEEPELVETVVFNDSDKYAQFDDILTLVNSGYKAIIFQREGG